jgi:putative spermidine/putrescine transport system ATP-binding protein
LNSQAHLVFDHVTKRYGDFVALHPVNLEIRKGEFFSIIGPSGSGKTTLLGAVAGYVPPSAGHIFLGGVDVVTLPPQRRNIGMVFQNYALFPHMTVAENIAFPLKMRRVGQVRIEEEVKRMLGVVRLDGKGDRKPSALSGGQQQRVALARAAIFDPELLLMDEPLGALDKNLRADMQLEIKRFQQALGTTVLYVTHDQEEAAAMSDRIAVMNQGRVEQVGTAQGLYEQPQNSFVASVLGEANMFAIRSIAPTGDGAAIETAGGLRLATTGRGGTNSSIVCVRPEAITMAAQPVDQVNRLAGRVIDAVHGPGTLRYLVHPPEGNDIIIRMPCARGEEMYPVGSEVHIGWAAKDTLIVDASP